MCGLQRFMFVCTCNHNMQYTQSWYPSPQYSRECLCKRIAISNLCSWWDSEGSKTSGGCTAHSIWALLHGNAKHNMSN